MASSNGACVGVRRSVHGRANGASLGTEAGIVARLTALKEAFCLLVFKLAHREGRVATVEGQRGAGPLFGRK